MKTILFIMLLLQLTVANAIEYYRCTDPNGNTSFSEAPCKSNAEAETIHVNPAKPSNRGQSRNAMEQLENYRNKVKRVEKITGKKAKTVPATKSDACEHITSLALRNARVRKDIMKCQSMDDVRHIYGQPNSVSEWSDRSAYDTKWTYRNRDTGRKHIYFKGGKVTKWSTHK